MNEEDPPQARLRSARRAEQVRPRRVRRSSQQEVPHRHARPDQGGVGLHPSAEQLGEVQSERSPRDQGPNPESGKDPSCLAAGPAGFRRAHEASAEEEPPGTSPRLTRSKRATGARGTVAKPVSARGYHRGRARPAIGAQGLHKGVSPDYIHASPPTGRSAARLARLLREQEVPGSNPGAPIPSDRDPAGLPCRRGFLMPA